MSQSESECTTIPPPRLRPGDTVAVCAPAGPVAPERLRAGVDRLGARYRVRVDDGVYAATGFLAGDDDRRAGELCAALADPDVRAVFIARGGYGTTRILGRLDPDALRRDPKLIVGFSDATALLAWALRAGVRAIHGPVVSQLGELGDDDAAWLFRLMEEPRPPGRPVATGLAAVGAAATGARAGPLAGGNLSLLAALAGTPWAVRAAGQVLVIEEVGERPYAIDRMMTQLGESDALSGARAALVGDFTRCEETSGPPEPDAGAVVDERLRHFGVPAARAAPFGHDDRNLALPLGARARVDFDRGELWLEEGAVA